MDFVVFNGMKGGNLKNILLLDSPKTGEKKILQKSIEKAVEKEKYEWITLRIDEDGSIDQE